MNLKLLQLAQVGIGTRSSGVQIRNYYLAKQLAKVTRVMHLGFAEDGNTIESDSIEGIRIKLIPRERAYTVAKLARAALSRTPVTLFNFYNRAMAAALRSELATSDYDTVLIEGVEMAGYLPVLQAMRNRIRWLVLDWHNIESELVERHSHYAATPFHQIFMQHTSRQLRRVEENLLGCCDLHLVTSERERCALLNRRPYANVVVLENGVDSHHYAPADEELYEHDRWLARHRVVFVGSMDYSANVEAVEYFAREAWPPLHSSLPQLVFTVVGRNPPQRIRDLAERAGIEVTGTVPDVRPYYRNAIAAIVPIRVAGGTRLKILEAMAAGVPVVSTRLGAEGLRIEPELHFMLADTPTAFRLQIERLAADFSLWRRVSGAGCRLVESTYDWKILGATLIQNYFSFFERHAMSDRRDSCPARLV